MTRDVFHCRNHLPVLSSFVAYRQVCNKSNTTGVTCEARTAGVHSWFLLGLCCHTLVPGAIFCRSLSVLFGYCIVYPFWSLYCLSFFDLWLLIKLLVLSNFSLCLCVNWCISMSTGKFCINMIHLYTQWVSCRRC